MTIPEAFLTATVALVAAVIGGVIQARTQQRFEREQFVKLQRVEAYLQYIRGISLLSHADNEVTSREALSLLTEARGKIALFGGKATLTALVSSFRQRSDIHSDTAWPVHASTLSAMRADCLGDETANQRELFETVYGSGPRKDLP